MTDEINATPEAVQGEDVAFDEKGELQLSEAGLDGLKELLKEGVVNEAMPEEENPEEPDEPAKETREEKPPKETPKEPPKRKLKVDGQEIEVSEDELVTLAQQGRDYTRKTQQLAEERNALAPYQALIKQLNENPALNQHIAKFWQQPQEPQTPKPQEFDDPIDQLRWEIKQEIMAETRKEIQQTAAPLQRMTVLNQVKAQVQADPDYKEIHQAIIDQVKSLPPAIQKNAYLQLDQDPQSYMEAFAHFKGLKAQNKTTPETPTEKQETLKTVKRTEKAPILESSNSAPSEDTVKLQRVKIDKAKARALREGSTDALQSFLEVGGFLDHLK
jgi:hypothetical protein